MRCSCEDREATSAACTCFLVSQVYIKPSRAMALCSCERRGNPIFFKSNPAHPRSREQHAPSAFRMSRLLNVDASTSAPWTLNFIQGAHWIKIANCKPAQPGFSPTIAAITLDSGCFDVRKLPTFEETLDRFLSTRLSCPSRVFRRDICQRIKCRGL